MKHLSLVSFFLFFFLWACGDDATVSDAGRADATSGRDSGSVGRDAAGTDAARADGGSTDGGSTDGGSTDGGSTDGGSIDAGEPGPCTDDAHEDDDTIALAMAVSPLSGIGAGGRVDVGAHTACPGDVDYFHAYADCCTVAGTDVAFTGDLDVSLVDMSGAMLTYSSDTMVTGRELRVAEHGGAFFVRIENTGAAPVAYDLTVYAMVFID
jgi:hypothetical protein